MAKKVMQIRYFGKDHADNYPKDISTDNLMDGSVFNDYIPITHLGIQTIPGVCFYLNNSIYPIIVDATGIFEIDFDDKMEIDSIRVEKDTLENLVYNNKDNSIQHGYLIFDIVYDDIGLGGEH